MLSFLRDEESENLSVCSSRSDSVVDKHTGGDGADNKQQSQEYFTVAAKSKRVCNTTHLLAVLFGAALLCLWFMVRQNTPHAAAASSLAADTQQGQIENAIVRLMGASSVMSTRMNSIMKKFYEFSTVQQVRGNELIKNPFRQEIFIGDRGNLFTAEHGDPNGDSPIELLSIMKTKEGNYCCMIEGNDRILYEGDSIKGFKVVQIGDGFVKLEGKPAGGQEQQAEIILKFSQ